MNRLAKICLIALALCALAPFVQAQSNSNPAMVLGNAVITVITNNGHAFTGMGMDLHGNYGGVVGFGLDLVGVGNTNEWLHFGIDYATFFDSKDNPQQLGLYGLVAWKQPPKIIKTIFLNPPSGVEIMAGANERVDGWLHGFNGYDWKQTAIFVSISRKF